MSRATALEGMLAGRPACGPETVHIDLTNACNAACITCWDHSPLLTTPRARAWKRRHLATDVALGLLDELAALGSVKRVVLSGMGDPLVHPDGHDLLEAAASRFRVTLMTNLLAADIDRVVESGVDTVLASVQGVTPSTYAAFHPGWNEEHFFRLCGHLRRISRAGVHTKHVQVIERGTAEELSAMVRFGRRFRAVRVNFKLASLAAGTEDCGITSDQRERLLSTDVPQARDLARELGVATNLDLFERQLQAAGGDPRATVPIEDVGCWMGFVYTRITAEQDVLYCCNTEVRVGSLRDSSFADLWAGERWQTLRDRLGRGEYFPGCARCGKFEQNAKWADRVRLRRRAQPA